MLSKVIFFLKIESSIYYFFLMCGASKCSSWYGQKFGSQWFSRLWICMKNLTKDRWGPSWKLNYFIEVPFSLRQKLWALKLSQDVHFPKYPLMFHIFDFCFAGFTLIWRISAKLWMDISVILELVKFYEFIQWSFSYFWSEQSTECLHN